MVSDISTELTETENTDLMNRAPWSDKWLVAGAENELSSIWTTVTFIQKIAASLHRAMREYSVETFFESSGSNFSNTARVSVSEKSSLLEICSRELPVGVLMMLFFFGVAALRAFFLEQYSDCFARRVVHRMRFTASIPTPKFEFSLGSRFGFVMLVLLFIFFPVAVTSGVSFLEGLLLILQVVVMAGLSVVSGPQLTDGG